MLQECIKIHAHKHGPAFENKLLFSFGLPYYGEKVGTKNC